MRIHWLNNLLTAETVLQATESPFGTSEQQELDQEDESGGADRPSTIDEVAEDIAQNWGRAPQPRRDAHRRRPDEQGVQVINDHHDTVETSALDVATVKLPVLVVLKVQVKEGV